MMATIAARLSYQSHSPGSSSPHHRFLAARVRPCSPASPMLSQLVRPQHRPHLSTFAFMDLPHDMQCLVVEQLDAKSIAALARTSKHFRELTSEEEVWRKCWVRHFGDSEEEAENFARNARITMRQLFQERWSHRVVTLGNWAIVRTWRHVYVVNKHMAKHGGVALMFSATSTALRGAFTVRAYHGTWSVSLADGNAVAAQCLLPGELDFDASPAIESDFVACGLKFAVVGKHSVHITPLQAWGRVERISLNSLSVGWLDLQVAGKLRTIYPSDKLDKGL